jgi:hypothetical protein
MGLSESEQAEKDKLQEARVAAGNEGGLPFSDSDRTKLSGLLAKEGQEEGGG